MSTMGARVVLMVLFALTVFLSTLGFLRLVRVEQNFSLALAGVVTAACLAVQGVYEALETLVADHAAGWSRRRVALGELALRVSGALARAARRLKAALAGLYVEAAISLTLILSVAVVAGLIFFYGVNMTSASARSSPIYQWVTSGFVATTLGAYWMAQYGYLKGFEGESLRPWLLYSSLFLGAAITTLTLALVGEELWAPIQKTLGDYMANLEGAVPADAEGGLTVLLLCSMLGCVGLLTLWTWAWNRLGRRSGSLAERTETLGRAD